MTMRYRIDLSLLRIFSAVCLTVFAAPGLAQASIANFSIGLKAGFSVYELRVGKEFANETDSTRGKTMNPGLELRPQFDIEFKALNVAFGSFYQARTSSEFGAFPLTRMGAGLYYYPNGFPLHPIMLDNGVSFVRNRLVPFISVQYTLGVAAVSIEKGADGKPQSFNGLNHKPMFGGGVRVPIDTESSLIIEALYEPFKKDDGSSSQLSTPIQLGGFNLLFGIAIYP